MHELLCMDILVSELAAEKSFSNFRFLRYFPTWLLEELPQVSLIS